jgi:hypothetical protein
MRSRERISERIKGNQRKKGGNIHAKKGSIVDKDHINSLTVSERKYPLASPTLTHGLHG